MVYLHGDEAVAAWPIGVGKQGEETPIGQFTVGPKQRDPVWFRPGHEPVAFGDPENPLGTRWLPWFQNGVKTGYGFHGTNDDAGVGARVSKGCVRMHNRDVEILYDILPQSARIVVTALIAHGPRAPRPRAYARKPQMGGEGRRFRAEENLKAPLTGRAEALSSSSRGRRSPLCRPVEGFDPGSERTLAVWIRHASRARKSLRAASKAAKG